ASVRIQAAEALARFGPEAKDAVPVLIDLMQKRKDDPRGWGQGGMMMNFDDAFLRAFRAIGSATVPPLVEHYKRSDKEQRLTVMAIWGSLGPKAEAAIPTLIATLEDRDKDIRGGAAWCLGWIGTGAKLAIPGLKKLLRESWGRNRIYMAASV